MYTIAFRFNLDNIIVPNTTHVAVKLLLLLVTFWFICQTGLCSYKSYVSCFDDLEQKVWPICNTVLGVIEDKSLITPDKGTLVLLRQPRRLQKYRGLSYLYTCISNNSTTRNRATGIFRSTCCDCWQVVNILHRDWCFSRHWQIVDNN